MQRGPREKKERALGVHLQLKGERSQSPKSAVVRKPYPPGAHGQRKRPRAVSDFGRQLKEKLKCKLVYGIDERTLRQIFNKAYKKQGSTGTNLVHFLEMRLDNVVFRIGIAPSRIAARKYIVDGHIWVNGRRTKSPGYLLKVNDMIKVRPESAEMTIFKNIKESLKKFDAPNWLNLDADKMEGKVLSVPQDESLPFEVNSLVESFSK